MSKFFKKKSYKKKPLNKKKAPTSVTSFEDDNRGNHAKNWQFPLRDDKFLKLLRDLAPSVPFTPEDVNDLMNPPDSLEDIIREKYADGKKKITSGDKIILDNIQRKKLANCILLPLICDLDLRHGRSITQTR